MSQITSQGALCEFVRVRSDHVIHRPPNITPTQGAGVCLAGLSAWKLLFEDAKVQPGHRILIYNGSGGVGMLAIQIAKAHGCHVTATASPRNFDLMKKLGADIVSSLSSIPSKV
jgi:NADPH:quinone reductase-like Zn-dependent oxidoreductase